MVNFLRNKYSQLTVMGVFDAVEGAMTASAITNGDGGDGGDVHDDDNDADGDDGDDESRRSSLYVQETLSLAPNFGGLNIPMVKGAGRRGSIMVFNDS